MCGLINHLDMTTLFKIMSAKNQPHLFMHTVYLTVSEINKRQVTLKHIKNIIHERSLCPCRASESALKKEPDVVDTLECPWYFHLVESAFTVGYEVLTKLFESPRHELNDFETVDDVVFNHIFLYRY